MAAGAVLPWLGLIVTLAPAPAVAQQAELRGRIVATSGRVVAGAEVLEAGGRGRTRADRDGRFRLEGLRPGARSFLARADGYTPLSFEVELTPGTITVELTLEPVPPRLPELTVEGDARGRARIEFDDRVASGFGTFVFADEIERRHVVRTLDLLRTVGSARVGTLRNGRPFLTFGRCAAIAVWIDGVPENLSPAEALSLVAPRDIEAMEIYAGPSEMPGRFGQADACAAVVIWTRGHLQ